MRIVLTMLTAVLAAGCGERPVADALPVIDTSAVAATEASGSGVLLGLSSGPDYRTLWIATDGDSAALLAEGSGLLVPRADGFWWVNVIALDDSRRVAVAGSVSRWDATVDSVRQADRAPSTARCGTTYADETIEFLGPDYLGTRAWGGEEGCAYGGPTRWERYRLGALDPTVSPVRDALDSLTARQLNDALVAFRDSVQAAIVAADSSMADLLVDCHDGSWTVRRRPGGWEVWGNLTPHRDYCDAETFRLSLPPPRTVVGAAPVPVHFDALRAMLPGVEDAIASPRGDLLVAVTRDSVYAARVTHGRAGALHAVSPRGGNIVMAEWALGRFVPRWTTQVRPLLASGGGS